MQAVVCSPNRGPRIFRYEDVADAVCGAGDVLIRVDTISIEGGDPVNREIGALARARIPRYELTRQP
jgi:NADPH2:quinone reductase